MNMCRVTTKGKNLINLYSYRNITVSYFKDNGKYIGVYSVACNTNITTGIEHDYLEDCKRDIFNHSFGLVNDCLKGGALVKDDIGHYFEYHNRATNQGQQALFL